MYTDGEATIKLCSLNGFNGVVLMKVLVENMVSNYYFVFKMDYFGEGSPGLVVILTTRGQEISPGVN